MAPFRVAFLPSIALAIAALAAAGAGHAAKVYKWTDRDGVVHYGDRPPPARAPARTVKTIPVRAEPGEMVRLRIESEAGESHAWADNTLAGPIEVLLRFTSRSNIAGEPALPARATIPPRGSTLVARLKILEPGRGGEFALRMEAVPGDPSAKPRDVAYLVPLAAPTRVDQGFGGTFSHTDSQNRYALDFAANEGTPVVAARDGIVMQVESDFEGAGLDREKLRGRANYIRIVHDDGTMALYAHLKPEGVLVRVGQRVRAGQRIGLSGNTGYTSGPHLHFAVQVNRGMRLVSIPFRMPSLPARPARPAPHPVRR